MRKFKSVLGVTLTIFISLNGFSQIIDIDYTKKQKSFLPDTNATSNNVNEEDKKPKVLKEGFVDFLSDGNIQASANLLRLHIGERNGFYVPFYIYTGASGNALGSEKLNKTTASNLLNPIGGTVNLSFNGLQNLKDWGEYTKLKLAYQLGGRIINGKNSETEENINFFNGITNIGLNFQTGAWPEDDPNNVGIFYIETRINGSISSASNLAKVFGKDQIQSNYLLGYAIKAGIEIKRVIDAGIGIYQYTNNSAVDLFKEPVIKFSLNYSLKK